MTGWPQAIVEVDPGHNPYPARIDEGEEEWAISGPVPSQNGCRPAKKPTGLERGGILTLYMPLTWPDRR
jgi:hypothetical protein